MSGPTIIPVAFKCDINGLTNHVNILLTHNKVVRLEAVEGAIVNAMDIALNLQHTSGVIIQEVETSYEEIPTIIIGQLKERAKLSITLLNGH